MYFIQSMFSDEIKKMLVQVITSWQVIAVSAVIIIYIFMVNYVARLHHRPRHPSMPKIKAETPETIDSQGSDTEDLGLE